MEKIRLGVNIDHIATLRQLRGAPYPNLVEAAHLVAKAGGDQITIHLREDRRHIQDQDVKDLKRECPLPLNLEMAATPEMTQIAKRTKPQWVCLVPEKRQEVTTEGGLNLEKQRARVARCIEGVKKSNIKVSLFVEPSLSAIKKSYELGADAVELHTGKYCLLTQAKKKSDQKIKKEIARIKTASEYARDLGLHVHAGHGFDYENVRAVAGWENPDRSPLIEEFNIGHVIVCRAVIVGLETAVRQMISSIQAP